ncbi:MAG: hypothetical protein U0610_17825 [bacterium]
MSGARDTTSSVRALALDVRWLRWVRWGSVALILGTLIPSSGGHVMWLNMHVLTRYALAIAPPRIEPDRASFLFLFGACSWTIALSGWLGLWIARNAQAHAASPSAGLERWSRRLFLFSWLAPCSFVALYTWRFHGFSVPAAALIVAAHLALGWRVSAHARQQADRWLAVLAYALLPAGVSLFGWICIAIIFLFCPDVIFAHGILLGGLGAAALLGGLARRWRERNALQRSADATRDGAVAAVAAGP